VLLFLLFAWVTAVSSGKAEAIILPLSGASLTVTIGGTGGAPAGTLTETWNGTGSADVSGFGTSITSVTGLTAGIFSGPVSTTVSDPALSPIEGFQLNVTNGQGDFAAIPPPGSTTIPGGGNGSGTMALDGSLTLCLSAPCGTSQQTGVVTLGVGTGAVGSSLDTINSTNLLGSFEVAGGYWTTDQAIASSDGGPSITATGEADSTHVLLVTPFLSRRLGSPCAACADLEVPGIAAMDLTFVPEPSAALLLVCGLAGLVAGRRRSSERAPTA
jgi:hypothetical protein